MKAFVYNNTLVRADKIDSFNRWLVSKGINPVENPIFQDVPEDCDIKDFENGVFSQSLYTARKQAGKDRKYEMLVERYIREKYSLNAELAILRQRNTKPDEFLAYHVYAEECKERAKAKLL
jgi:hypothetical protein